MINQSEPIWKNLLSAAAVLIWSVTAYGARLYVDARPTNLDPKDQYNDIFLREVPRQMLLIMALDEFGVETLDPTIEQAKEPDKDDVFIGLQRMQYRDKHILHIDLFDRANQVIDASDISYEFLAHGLPRIRDMVKNMEEQNAPRWRELLAKQLGIVAHLRPWNVDLRPAREIEKYLNVMDFHSAFMAARALHREINTSGESPARLSALIRAYTNLAEAMRDVNSGHSSAMFARAYVYSQRLLRLAPKDSLSWRSRAYVEAIHGMVLDARADFDTADQLNDGLPQPSWALTARQLIDEDTPSLIDKAPADAQALASYLAWRTVEHSALSGLTIRFARKALERNPDSLRAFNSIAWNSSPAALAKATIDAPLLLNDLMHRLDRSSDEIPPAVQEAAHSMVSAEFSPDAVRTFRDTLATLPHSDEPHLPWSVYAGMIREWNFVQTFSRLFYIDYDTCSNPSTESQRLWPIVSDHRYAAVISSFNQDSNTGGRKAVPLIQKVHFYDDTEVFSSISLANYLVSLGLAFAEPQHTNWNNFALMQGDRSVFNVAASLWHYRYSTGPGFTESRRIAADLLDELSPNHPVALMWRATIDPEKLLPRAEQIEKQLPGNPMACYALGIMYSRLKQYDRAADLLLTASLYAPDPPVFEELGEISLIRDDVYGYTKIWDQYFRNSEETGHDHATVRNGIAVRLLRAGQAERAIPYARAAAEERVANGAKNYLLALTRAGHYQDAEALFNTGRFGVAVHYRWCRETGRGDFQGALQLYSATFAQAAKSSDAAQLLDLANYYWLEGDLDHASEYLEKSFSKDPTRSSAQELALIRFQQNRMDDAIQSLDMRLARPEEPEIRFHGYTSATEQLKKYFQDKKALPAMDARLTACMENPICYPAYGSIMFLFGKACELQGDTDQAKTWYRRSLDTPSADFTGRDAAAVGLRRLGEEYYK